MNTALQAMNAVQNTIEELRAENDKLKDCAQDLLKELAAERKFRDEFEVWLDVENKKHHDDYLKELNPSTTASSVAYERCLFMCRNLKTEHLGSINSKESKDDGTLY